MFLTIRPTHVVYETYRIQYNMIFTESSYIQGCLHPLGLIFVPREHHSHVSIMSYEIP
jgi:hypothetical protein